MIRLFTVIMLISIFASCKQANNQDSSELQTGLTEDFEQFYRSFHQDSSYQLSHILFPLSGIPVLNDSLPLDPNFKWKREEWVLHKEMSILKEEYVKDIQQMSDDMVIEKIRHAQYRFAMERRFAKMDDEWMLIYYATMNPY